MIIARAVVVFFSKIGLAGIQNEISEIFLEHHINGAALTTILRDDLIRMGIIKLDQQLILMQSIDLLLNLVGKQDLCSIVKHTFCSIFRSLD